MKPSATRIDRPETLPGTFLLALVLASPLAAAPASRPAATRADGPPVAAAGEEITPRSRDAVIRGLKWLAEHQEQDGSFGSGQYRRHVAVTSLACLAFMCNGDMPNRGKYGATVQKGLDYVLSCGDSASGFLAGADTTHGPMYGHGFATLFLAEVYGMTGSSQIEEKLRKAVRLIVDSQNGEGGWRYQPRPEQADISVTICQVMALRAARNGGIAVPKETIDKAIAYVKKSQNPDGGFRYMLSSVPPESLFPRSAAGVATLYYAGIYEGPEIERGLGYLMAFLPGKGRQSEYTYFFYGHYYAVQAMFLAGGDFWARWWPAIRDELITSQSLEGHWEGEAGREYGTAMALIILQMPKRLLPIFQR